MTYNKLIIKHDTELILYYVTYRTDPTKLMNMAWQEMQ